MSASEAKRVVTRTANVSRGVMARHSDRDRFARIRGLADRYLLRDRQPKELADLTARR